MARFRSRFEGDIAVALSNQGYCVEYERYRYSYKIEAEYVPDFSIESPHGLIHVEAKGRFTNDDRQKILRVRLAHPELRLFIVFQNPYAKINKKSATTYADWCDKHGVAWCPAPIPPWFLMEWLTGKRPTFRARAAKVQMELPLTKTVRSTASSANNS